MVGYDELYDYLRKEKYGEQLQNLPKGFVKEVGEYFKERKKELSGEDVFSESLMAEKKKFENAISIFRELILRRKKKILNLVFVASETGIMKRDFGNMLDFEQEMFEGLIGNVEGADKALSELLSGDIGKAEKDENKMIIVDKEVEAFVDMSGNVVGPFGKGELANLDAKVAEILVSDGRAKFVDE